MRLLYYVTLVITLAGICFASTADADKVGPKENRRLVGIYQGLAEPNESSTRSGWVPKSTTRGAYAIASDAPEGTFPEPGTEEFRRRERLRQAYQGRTAGKSRPYLALSQDIDCPCGPDCKCPPHVCKNGYCKKNYAVMFSASWCAPCKRMFEVVKELRKQGYIVMYYQLDLVVDGEKPYEDLDAKFHVNRFPTFIIFDEGEERHRAEGVLDISYFKDRLKTKAEQEAEAEEDERVYDL